MMDKKTQIDKMDAIMELTAIIDDWAYRGLISDKEVDEVNELIQAII